jgi:sulfatase modifying factor 1
MLLRILLLLLLPASAIAQDCDCCKIRTLGQQKYDAGDYTGAKSTWETAKKMGDAAKCTDLDALIAKAKKKIPPPKLKQSAKPKTNKPKQTSTNPVTTIPSPVTHGKKSGLTMIPVAGGTFTMGSPDNELNRNNNECQHSVTVDNFAMGQYEVTQADWKEVMGTDPSRFEGCGECPVEQVSWNDVQEFIKAANQKYSRKYRLPTEAEWEYAARGGKKSQGFKYAGTNETASLYLYANFCDSECTYSLPEKNQTDGYENMAPVGRFRANELGLYDMSGNVWEWCDNYGPYPGCTEPKEGNSRYRVLRGGSWVSNVNVCRVAYRFWNGGTLRSSDYGFRLAQD